jgi:large subunit ribosomal protein L21
MYAVVSTGGKQLKVTTGAEAVVEKLDVEVGQTVTFDVLFVADEDSMVVDPGAVASALVTAEVLEHFKGEKKIIFKFKKRKGYKRLKGHRQDQTRVRITEIALAGGGGKPAKAKAAAKPKAEPKPRAAAKPKAEPKAKAAAKPKAAAKEASAVEVAAVAVAQCKAIKADGERCSNHAKEGSKYCGVHAKKYDE